MPGGGANNPKKQAFLKRIEETFLEYDNLLLVKADNVGSSQFHQIRAALRGTALVLMGKNTLIRKAIRNVLAKKPSLEALLPYIKTNLGIVFTKGSLMEVKKVIQANQVQAPAKAGAVAPVDVIVPAGPTGMDPTMTGFLQALNISSKINKGQVEITSEVHLIKVGEKVGNSEATLLEKLKIRPFSYGLIVETVLEEGSLYSAAVLDITDDDVLAKFQAGSDNITAICLALHYPSIASVMHMVINGYKNLMYISLATDYTFDKTEKIKAFLADPEAMAAAAAAASAAPAASSGGAAEAKVEEPEEEEDADMGFSLFD